MSLVARNSPHTKLTTPHARCTRLVGNQKSGGLKSAGLVVLCIDGNRLKESWVSGYVLFPCQPRLYNTHAHHTLTQVFYDAWETSYPIVGAHQQGLGVSIACL